MRKKNEKTIEANFLYCTRDTTLHCWSTTRNSLSTTTATLCTPTLPAPQPRDPFLSEATGCRVNTKIPAVLTDSITLALMQGVHLGRASLQKIEFRLLVIKLNFKFLQTRFVHMPTVLTAVAVQTSAGSQQCLLVVQ